jgi:hypothetical protein
MALLTVVCWVSACDVGHEVDPDVLVRNSLGHPILVEFVEEGDVPALGNGRSVDANSEESFFLPSDATLNGDDDLCTDADLVAMTLPPDSELIARLREPVCRGDIWTVER